MAFLMGMLAMLALTVAAGLLWRLAGWVQRPARCQLAVVLPVQGRVENLEQLVRYAAHVAQGQPFERLVVADCGMDGETLALCQRLCAATGATLTPAAALAQALRVEPGAGKEYTDTK